MPGNAATWNENAFKAHDANKKAAAERHKKCEADFQELKKTPEGKARIKKRNKQMNGGPQPAQREVSKEDYAAWEAALSR